MRALRVRQHRRFHGNGIKLFCSGVRHGRTEAWAPPQQNGVKPQESKNQQEQEPGEEDMSNRRLVTTIMWAAVLCATIGSARAQEIGKYPDWKGMWVRIGAGGTYDPTKPPMLGQDPPLTAEYRKIWEANLEEARSGGQSYNDQVHCLPSGMPRMMMAYEPLETIITPEITYVQVSFNNEFRRIYTDGRDWPTDQEPTFAGYSIGKWLDTDGDARFDTLEVETRGMKGFRIFDPTGIPTHKDNKTIVRERIFLDKTNPNILRNEVTTFDNALTRPWTVLRGYTRKRDPVWVDHICAENNEYIFLGKETYTIDHDGKLTPTRKDQPPPDLTNFKRAEK
jgi:hypothetical protein